MAELIATTTLIVMSICFLHRVQARRYLGKYVEILKRQNLVHPIFLHCSMMSKFLTSLKYINNVTHIIDAVMHHEVLEVLIPMLEMQFGFHF